MLFIPILLAMLRIAPSRDDADTLFRTQLAVAIADGTDDAHEQATLVRLAWFESNFRRSVASCKVKGDHGKSLGTFQVQPRSEQDRRDACGSLRDQVAVALRFMRRSIETCSENVGSAKLNLYTSGRCDRGHHESSLRWGAPQQTEGNLR